MNETNIPFFSIIIPTYNRSSILERSINSVLNQSFKNLEIIIIDDGSTDNTKEVVNDFSDNRILYHYVPHGERSKARNIGINRAHGQYIGFLDSDDVLLNNHLLQVYNQILKSNNNKSIYHTGLIVENGKEKKYCKIYNSKYFNSAFDFILRCKIGIHDFIFPKELFNSIGFHENLNRWEDKHLILRALCTHTLIGIPEYTHIYYEGQFSEPLNSNSICSNVEEEIQAITDLELHLINKRCIKKKMFNKFKAKRLIYASYNFLNIKEYKKSLLYFKKSMSFSKSKYMLLVYFKFIGRYLFYRLLNF